MGNDKYKEVIKGLCLFDDEFFRACLKGNKPAAELIMKIILQKEKIEIEDMDVQYDMKSLKGRSVLMDLYLKADGKPCDVEVERTDSRTDPRRARFHSSLLDMDSLDKGEDFPNLPDTYMIFITENDVMGDGLPCYIIERMIKSLDRDFNDGSHIIYVNGSYKGDDDFGRLMHDFGCTDPDDMYFEELKDKVRYFKEEGGEIEMSETIENIWKDGKAVGVAEGEARGETRGMVLVYYKDMLLSPAEIAKKMNIPKKKVNEIIRSVIEN